MITQITPSIPMFVPGKGTGECIAIIDYGPEHHLLYLIGFDDTGELWSVPNPQVRLCRNPSMLRDWKHGKEISADQHPPV